VTPQNANHYSLTQGQVNILQAFSIQPMGIYATVWQCDSSILQRAITMCYQRGIILTSHNLCCEQ